MLFDAIDSVPNLDQLLDIFYSREFSSENHPLGDFHPVQAFEMPRAAQKLLAHEDHMTVTVEAFHQSPVAVEVLDRRHAPPAYYARKILLRRTSDGAVVQFGLVRLNFAVVAPEVRSEIESERIPLGRVLIEHNVLRQVKLARLWRIECHQELADLFTVPPGTIVYGRTALIQVDGAPAVELLEVVSDVG